MIEVKYDKSAHTLTVDGHAGGKLGSDIVCAATSILIYTVAENVYSFDRAEMIEHGRVRIEEGHAEIAFEPKADYTMIIDIIMLSLLRGFRLLAKQEPEKVRLDEGDISE